MDRPVPLRVRDLVVRGEDGRAILTIDRLDVSPGEAVGLRGPSGAGKSTLLLALAGLAPGMSGQLIWGDDDIVSLGSRERAAFRRRHVGLMFQHHHLFGELDAEANGGVAALFEPAPERAAVERRAAQRLDALGVPRGRRADLLSGGERQRVSLARALANDPGVLLADEPTASLHADAAIDVIDTLARATGRTRVVASHDPRLLERMDRVLDLDGGALVPPSHPMRDAAEQVS